MVREVLKWNKDYINNKIVNVKCLKEDNGLIGKVNIKLFDKDGNVTNETFTENVIPNVMFDNEMYANMYNKIKSGFYRQNNTGGTVGTGGAFNNLVLGSSLRDENSSNILMDCGDIIGWCPIDSRDAGSDITRGIYNPTESYTKFEKGYYHAHLVYDFGTSQGNGTFNSIWWARKLGSGSICSRVYGEWFNSPGGSRNKSAIDDYVYYPGVNGEFYIELLKKSNKIHKIKNPLYYFNNSHTLEYDEKEEFKRIELPLAHQVINSENDFIKISNYNQTSGNGNTLQCNFDLELRNKNNEIIDTVKLDVVSNEIRKYFTRYNSGSMYMQLHNIFKVTDTGSVFMTFECMNSTYTGSSSYYIFPKYDDKTDSITGIDGNGGNGNCEGFSQLLGIYNIYSKTWVLEPSLTSVESRRITSSAVTIRRFLSCVSIQGEDYYYSLDKKQPYYDLLYSISETPGKPYRYNIKSYSGRNITGYPFSYDGYARYCHVPGADYLIAAGSSYGSEYGNNYIVGDLKLTHAYSAHTKLPNPVTKTSADTMKIQYDYYIQVPKSFSTDGDFLTLPEFVE